jgi:hypothetical protein
VSFPPSFFDMQLGHQAEGYDPIAFDPRAKPHPCEERARASPFLAWNLRIVSGKVGHKTMTWIMRTHDEAVTEVDLSIFLRAFQTGP